MAILLVEVAINGTPGSIDQNLTYQVPPVLEPEVKEGSLVLVTVGRQLVTGVVVALSTRTDRDGLKTIRAVLARDYLPPGLLKVGRFLAERYCCPLALALNALLPPASRQRLEDRWRWLPAAGDDTRAAINLAGCLPATAREVAFFLADHREAPAGRLQRLAAKEDVNRALQLLQAHGLVQEGWSWRDAPRERQPVWVVARQEAAATVENLGKKAPRQAAILRELLAGGARPAASFTVKGGYAPLRRLQEQGLIDFIQEPEAADHKELANIILNPAQEKAVKAIKGVLGKGGTFLLYGVTGSGKTEVYLSCAREALERGYQALFLVPEHALIPQMLARLRQRLGVRAVAIHGDLPAGQRAEIWEQARQGKIQVITGSRSALFAPLPRLGLIVVDEEHASSYKQDCAPRYDAREVAIKRGQLEGAVVVLGSATPSTESFYLARQGKVQLLQLPGRVGDISLPLVEVVDLRAEFRAGNQGLLSRRLQEEVNAALRTGQQVILFLNRRGYAPHLVCRLCGHVPLCRHCNVALTYHQDSTLRCHYCGYLIRADARCPRCGGSLTRLGAGTQRVEEEVRALWPRARVLRADGDTTSRKGQWERIYHTFASGQAEILIGTQTITKGMDFPGVAVVGVINADLSLYQPDFRARERTFQLLTQVAGRAGRKNGGGRVVIQTYNPQDPAIALATSQDYDQFYQQEIAMRQGLRYPPFIKLVRLGFTGLDEARVIETTHAVAGIINRQLDRVEVLGPAPGYPSRVKDHYRWQLMLKVPGWSRYKKHLQDCLATYRHHRDVHMIIDVGPINPW